MGLQQGILPAPPGPPEAHYRVMETNIANNDPGRCGHCGEPPEACDCEHGPARATQQEANLAAAAGRQHIEDVELLRVWQEAGVQLSYEVGKKIFDLEVSI